KSAVSLYEKCQQIAENYTRRLDSDNSFQLFLRILAQCLCKSKQRSHIWRQIKGREFSECSDPSNASSLWSLVSLYLDYTTDLVENSKSLSHQEHLLLSPSIQLLLNKVGMNELKVVLTFIEAMINKLL
ncbi:hypothetical protein LSH36_11g10015, partial [Paralvinella palmiformis]